MACDTRLPLLHHGLIVLIYAAPSSRLHAEAPATGNRQLGYAKTPSGEIQCGVPHSNPPEGVV